MEFDIKSLFDNIDHDLLMRALKKDCQTPWILLLTPVRGTLAETINGLYKTEVIYRKSLKSRAEVEMATLEWVDWFNHRRLFGPIGSIPPAEAEMNYYQQQIEHTKVA